MGTLPHILCCLDALIRNDCFNTSSKTFPSVATELGKCCWNAFANTSSVSLLCVGIDLMCGLLRFDKEMLQKIVLMLNHRYPLVRQHCSLQLHLQFIAHDHLCKESSRQEIANLLIEGSTSESSV